MNNDFPVLKLLDWFSSHKRKLPWRKKYSPYHVWISEVMAQQTRIEQMLPYYKKFLKQFPTVKALADADEQSVLKSWEGLGYYSRARNLHAAAKQINEKFGGKLPEKKEQLQELKGFGPYISSAVASIAFNEDVCVVDGNVLRVASRFWGMKENIALPQTRKRMEKMLQEVLPNGKARDFNQALMELGALVCLPENPLCGECPLQRECFAFLHGKQNDFPIKTKRSKTPHRHFAMAMIEKGGKIWLTQRKTKLLHGLWEFPSVEFNPLTDDAKAIVERFEREWNVSLKLGSEVSQITHSYSHFTQHVHVFRGETDEIPSFGKWVSEKELDSLPLSKAQQKVFSALGN